jgi:hypothetical protein
LTAEVVRTAWPRYLLLQSCQFQELFSVAVLVQHLCPQHLLVAVHLAAAVAALAVKRGSLLATGVLKVMVMSLQRLLCLLVGRVVEEAHGAPHHPAPCHHHPPSAAGGLQETAPQQAEVVLAVLEREGHQPEQAQVGLSWRLVVGVVH